MTRDLTIFVNRSQLAFPRIADTRERAPNAQNNSGVAKRMLSPNVRTNVESRSFQRRELLEKVQLASLSMLKSATAAMAAVRPDLGACALDLAGGCLAFSGADVPLTRAVGVGTAGPVTTEEIDAIENFYATRKSPVRIAMSGLSCDSFHSLLSGKGYVAGQLIENWWRPLSSPPPSRIADGIEVIPVGNEHADLWVRTVVAGFEEVDSPVDDQNLSSRLLETFYCLGFAQGARPFLVRRKGEAAGGGVLFVDGGTAHLRTTSCRFAHRRNGVQTALLGERLREAHAAGCKFVFSSTEGIGVSARNLGRFGLEPLSISYLMSKPN